jgi:hypothetical protein
LNQSRSAIFQKAIDLITSVDIDFHFESLVQPRHCHRSDCSAELREFAAQQFDLPAIVLYIDANQTTIDFPDEIA